MMKDRERGREDRKRGMDTEGQGLCDHYTQNKLSVVHRRQTKVFSYVCVCVCVSVCVCVCVCVCVRERFSWRRTAICRRCVGLHMCGCVYEYVCDEHLCGEHVCDEHVCVMSMCVMNMCVMSICV